MHHDADVPGAHLIQQAEVAPLDVDGVQAATVGTGVFAVATVIMLICYDRLRPPAMAGGSAWPRVASDSV